MSTLWVNAIKVGFVVALYLFLWFVARAIGRHLRVPAATPPGRSTVPAPDAVVVTILGADGIAARHLEVRGPLVVGRGPVDVVVDDPFASDRHLRFDVNAGRLIVEDLGSTNGTLVNDVVIHEPTIIAAGDRVRIGTTTMEVT